ncbi:MAG: outer membrane protein [Janthinobacterium lividum]
MSRSLSAAFAIAVLSSAAVAADLPTPRMVLPAATAPVPLFTWTGFYVGLNAGDAFSAHDSLSGRAPGFGSYLGGQDDYHLSTSTSGFTGGGQLGYNYQFGAGSGVVAGIEGDFAYTDLSATRALPTEGALAGLSTAYRTNHDGVGTIRGRLGYGFGPLLVYGTGGFAYDLADRQSLVTAPGGAELLRLDVRSVDVGYAAGGGVEYALPVGLLPAGLAGLSQGGAITVRAEYLHVATGQHSVPLTVAGQAVTLHMHDAVDLGRAGINYKF